MNYYEYTSFLNDIEILSYKKIDISSREKNIVGTRFSLETSKETVNIDFFLEGTIRNYIIIYKDDRLYKQLTGLDLFEYKQMIRDLVEKLEENQQIQETEEYENETLSFEQFLKKRWE